VNIRYKKISYPTLEIVQKFISFSHFLYQNEIISQRISFISQTVTTKTKIYQEKKNMEVTFEEKFFISVSFMNLQSTVA
jgi:hypothetical protein